MNANNRKYRAMGHPSFSKGGHPACLDDERHAEIRPHFEAGGDGFADVSYLFLARCTFADTAGNGSRLRGR